jgi:hypothetical protein
VKNAKTIQERLNKNFEFLENFQKSIDDAIENLEGDPEDED